MPREVWRGETAKSARIYRLVDARAEGTAGPAQYTIERVERDAMGGERWVHVEISTNPDLIWDLLLALAESHVEKRPVTFAVQSAATPEHLETT